MPASWLRRVVVVVMVVLGVFWDAFYGCLEFLALGLGMGFVG